MKRKVFLLTVIFSLMLTQLAWAGEYTVKSGDYLSKIGKQSGVAWQEIAKANNINAPYIIFPGQKLIIPSTKVSAQPSSNYLDTIKALQAEIASLEARLQATKLVKSTTVKKEVVETGNTTAEEQTVATVETELEVQQTVGQNEEIVPKTGQASGTNDQSAYMTGGGWKSFDAAKESEGKFLSGKVRYRPFVFYASGHKVGLGGFLLGEIGSGTSMKKYDFDWWKVGGGVSSKIYGNRWDNSTDLGVTWQKDSGGNSEQNTYSAYLSNYLNLEQRRGAGEKWFPQTEIGLSATIPFSASKENTKNGQSMTADKKFVLGAEVKQSIYDLSLSDNHKLIPGLMAGVGLEADNVFGKFGPFIKWRAHNQDILMLELFAKKVSSVDGFRGYALLFLNFDGARKAVKSALITQPTADDLVANK